MAFYSWNGCSSFKATLRPHAAAILSTPAAVTVRSLTDTTSVTALVAVGDTLWVGTARGLIRWTADVAEYTVVTPKDGLPASHVLALAPDGAGGVWVVTSGGAGHLTKAGGSWRKLPMPPVGDFVTGLVEDQAGTLWVGGPEGLARLGKDGQWQRRLGSTEITALAASAGDVWVGTSGHGVVRLRGDEALVYGTDQGCLIDVVRGIAAAADGSLVAIGKDAGEKEHIARFDGKTFSSYRVETSDGGLPEWVRRVGNATLVISGNRAYALSADHRAAGSEGAFKLQIATPAGVRKAPLRAPAAGDLPDVAAADKANAAPSKNKRSEVRRRRNTQSTQGAIEASVAKLELATWGPLLPGNVTSVAPDGAALYVGTRFLGAAQITADRLMTYRTGDLAQNAVRLTVACVSRTDCYVATGGIRAWRYLDGVFEPAEVDPEPGSRVLAMVASPESGVLAVHRGAKDPVLRISTVASGRWTPVGVQEVHVPEGVPDITFAQFAPGGHLWLGLNYVDHVGDRIDYGAAEVILDEGKVIYHSRYTAKRTPRLGLSIPNDVQSAYFRSGRDIWFGTHSGVVHVVDGDVQLYTENDGLESEVIRDILAGPDGRIWLATSRGVGKYDGTNWVFPREHDELRVRATALASDTNRRVFIGTDDGLLIKEPGEKGTGALLRIDFNQGLLDNHVRNLAVDASGRLWVLTKTGLSILERTGDLKKR